MSATRFDDLLEGVCTLMGISLPTPRPTLDTDGVLAFHLRLDGTSASVFQRPLLDADTVFVVIELGTLPADAELAALRQLMEANFWLLGRQAPCFARHPATAQTLLQWSCPLASTAPADLHRAIRRAAGLATDWVALARDALGPAQALPPFVRV